MGDSKSSPKTLKMTDAGTSRNKISESLTRHFKGTRKRTKSHVSKRKAVTKIRVKRNRVYERQEGLPRWLSG